MKMVYVDKTKPSNGFVAFFILVAVGSALLLMLIGVEFTYIIWGQGSTPIFIVFLFYYLLVLFLIGIVIHAGYNTEYRIEKGKLWMKIGYLKKGIVLQDEINGVEKVGFILVFFPRSYYCNRFKNGISIITEKRVTWLTPEDSKRFISELGLKTSK
jgi:energy-coupling factor transporter transmembrane protein EcfT